MTVFFLTIAVVGLCFGLVAFRGAPYVPTRRKQIQQTFDELYAISKQDIVVDLGSGDGALLRETSRRGSKKSIGYELNPILVITSKLLGRYYQNIETKWADFWRQELPSETTLVYVFTDGRDARKVKRYLDNHVAKNKKKLFVISYAFFLPGIKPKKSVGPMHLYELKA